MKSFKQVLALLVVATMMLSTVAFAAVVPADVVGTANEPAVTLLSALNIMVGDDQGKFNAEAPVKRSEMAKIVVKMVGSDAAATAATGSVTFSDVPASHWANGYVNVASSLGIVKGLGDGTFAPDAEVTYAQAITMIMRALGYEPAANDRGGYPNGYYVLASQYDVTDGVDTPSGQAAIRGSIAKLISNALSVPLMIQNGYGTESRFVESGTDSTDFQYVIKNKLKLDWYKGTVYSFNTTDKKVEFQNVTERVIKYADISKDADSDDFKDTVSASKNLDYLDGVVFNANLKGTEVEYFTNDKDKVVAFKLPKNSETFFSAIKTFNDDSENVYDATAYYSLSGKDGAGVNANTVEKIKSITFKNGQKYTVGDALNKEGAIRVFAKDSKPFSTDDSVADEYDNIKAANKLLVKGTIVDGELSKLYFYEFNSSTGLVTEITDSTIKLTRDGTTTNTVTLSRLNVAPTVTVINDGQLASIKDIKVGAYLEYSKYEENDNDDEKSYIIAVSSTPVSGTISRVAADGTSFYAGDKKVKPASTYYVSTNGGKTYTEGTNGLVIDLDSLLQENASVITNLVGKAIFINGTGTSTDFFGILDRAYSSGGDKYVKVLIKNNDVTEAKAYALADDIKATDNEIDFTVKASDGEFGYTKLAATDAISKAVYKFSLDSDGKIDKVKKLTVVSAVGIKDVSTVADPADKNYVYKLRGDSDQVSVRIQGGTSNKHYDVDTDVFFVDTKNIYKDKTDTTLPKIVLWDNLKDKELDNQFKLDLVLDTDNELAIALMDNGTAGLTGANLKFGFVKDSYTKSSDDSVFTLFTSAGTVDKAIDTDDANDVSLAKNKIVIYDEVGTDGMEVPATSAVFTIGTASQYDPAGDADYYFKSYVAAQDVTKSNQIDLPNGEKYTLATGAFVVAYDTKKAEYVSDDLTNIQAGVTVWYIWDKDTEKVMGVVFTK